MTAPSSEAISTANAAAGALLVDWSRHHGVQNAVVSPGSRNTPIALAFWQSNAVNTEVVLTSAVQALCPRHGSSQPASVALVCTSGARSQLFQRCRASQSGLFCWLTGPLNCKAVGHTNHEATGFYGTLPRFVATSAPWNMGDLETWHALTQC